MLYRPHDPARRRLMLGALPLVLAGCTPDSTLGMLHDSFTATLGGSDAYARTRQQVDDLAFAQLGVRIGRGGRSIMVLNEVRGDDLYWISANRILLVTRKGRIVRSVGLTSDLLGTRLFGQDLLDAYDYEHPQIDGLETSRSVDTAAAHGESVRARFRVEGSETITILDRPFETLRVREEARYGANRWKATNLHWLSKRSALIWQSRQFITDGSPAIEIQVLKRPPA
jgi:hypothetical protein